MLAFVRPTSTHEIARAAGEISAVLGAVGVAGFLVGVYIGYFLQPLSGAERVRTLLDLGVGVVLLLATQAIFRKLNWRCEARENFGKSLALEIVTMWPALLYLGVRGHIGF